MINAGNAGSHSSDTPLNPNVSISSNTVPTGNITSSESKTINKEEVPIVCYPYRNQKSDFAQTYEEFIQQFPLAKDSNYITVILSPENRGKKPSDSQYIEINGSLLLDQNSNPITEVSYEASLLRGNNIAIIRKDELVKLLTPPYSRSFSFSVLKGHQKIQDNFLFAQGMAFDIDNPSKILATKSSVNAILRDYDLEAFCYDSFSHGKYKTRDGRIKPRFRVVWFFDKPITDKDLYVKIYKHIAKLIKADEKCHNVDRHFYGGKNCNVLNPSEFSHLKSSLPKTCNLNRLLNYTYFDFKEDDFELSPDVPNHTTDNSVLAAVGSKKEDSNNNSKLDSSQIEYCAGSSLNLAPNKIRLEERQLHFLWRVIVGDEASGLTEKQMYESENIPLVSIEPSAINIEDSLFITEEGISGELYFKPMHHRLVLEGIVPPTTTEIDKPLHPVLFWLASNLIPIRRGKKMFSTLLKHHQKVNFKEKKKLSTYISKRYKTSRPIYPNGWEQLPSEYLDKPTVQLMLANGFKNMVQIRPFHHMAKAFNMNITNDSVLPKIEDIRLKLIKDIDQIYNHPDGKIHLIKFPLGGGKSTAVLQRPNLLFAARNYRLLEEKKNEYQYDLCSTMKLNLELLPIDYQKQLRLYWNRGLSTKSSQLLTDFINDSKYNDNEWLEAKAHVQAYKNAISEALESTDSVFTSHVLASFLNFKEHEIYVVDESIIPTILQVEDIKLSDLGKLYTYLNRKQYSLEANAIKRIKGMIENGIEYFSTRVRFETLGNSKRITEVVLENAHKFSGDVLGFLKHGAFKTRPIDPDNPDTDYVITYAKVNEIRKDKTYIILSATPEIELYKAIFKDRLVIHNFPEVETKGEYIQVSSKAISHSFLRDNPYFLKQVTDEIGEDFEVITFKDILKKKTYFWNEEGWNIHSGKNLIICGTPYPHPTEIWAIASLVGFNITFDETLQEENGLTPNGDFKLTPDDFNSEGGLKVNKRSMLFNNVRSNVVTYSNPKLREIQTTLIYNRMIQAIERARTIYHDAVILILSEFPVKGNARHYHHYKLKDALIDAKRAAKKRKERKELAVNE